MEIRNNLPAELGMVELDFRGELTIEIDTVKGGYKIAEDGFEDIVRLFDIGPATIDAALTGHGDPFTWKGDHPLEAFDREAKSVYMADVMNSKAKDPVKVTASRAYHSNERHI